ncbi:MAG: cyclic nucleotide-binding domain-containing protein [Pikeienuella sp.]|uniref:cyclic nucleotide-binding domain-containing protein n=1 Tax=Pikeienuella sp. TaxID=2831957 RepID=UPI00391AAA2A
MELTLESAFSTGGLVGHLSYILLVISMLMRRLGPLRVLVILSAFVAILYDWVWLKDPVGVFWESLLVLVNIAQLTLAWRANRRARFTAEEAAFVSARLTDLRPGEARRLLNRGVWIDGAPGLRLTTEGEPVSHLVWIASGEAEIAYRGRVFTRCRAGNFIGEMSVVEEGPASADATLSAPARLWLISGAAVRRLWRDEPELAAALEKAFSRDWREKLAAHRPEAEEAAA